MFKTPGFSQNSLNTSLGKMVYYTADRSLTLFDSREAQVALDQLLMLFPFALANE